MRARDVRHLLGLNRTDSWMSRLYPEDWCRAHTGSRAWFVTSDPSWLACFLQGSGPGAGERAVTYRCPRPPAQVGRAVEFTESAFCLGEDGMRPGEALGLETGDTGQAVEEGLDALHHARAPGVVTMEP